MPGDEQIVARDPWIRALPLVLDDERLTAHVRAHWSAAEPAPDSIAVHYLRYKPGTQVLADLLLSWESHEQHALLIATAPGADTKLHKQRRHAHERRQPVMVDDPDRLLLVVAADADRHLPGCHRLLERIGWLDRSLRGCELHVLAYKPHRRLVARIDDDGAPVGLLKIHHPGLAAGAITAMRWAEQHRGQRIRLPELRGVDVAAGAVLTGWTPGTALDEQEPDRYRSTLRAVGKQLGRMHQLAPGRLTANMEDAHRHTVLQGIIRVRPDLAVPAARALRTSPTLEPLVPIHGDLSPDQVVHDGDGVTLIDLDRAGLGSPSADLASWIAAGLVADHTSASGTEIPTALWEGYASVDGPASLDGVMARVPEQLLRRAVEPFRLRQRDWQTRTEELVLHAERLTTLTGAA